MAGARRTGGISPVQKEYLDVLRSALWGEKLASGPKDLDGVLKIANIQRTRPLIFDALQRVGYEDPDSMDLIYRTASAHINQNRVIAELTGMFRRAGIEPVLLKGEGVARYYPEPMLRECGDIDLYVGEESFDKACSLVKENPAASLLDNGSETDRHLQLKFKRIYVEIHRASAVLKNKKQNEYYQQLSRKGLTQDLVVQVFDDVPVNTPADSFNAFYLFYHFMIHSIFGGVGLRQICDWIIFLHSHSGKIDTGVISEALGKLNLWDIWKLYASVAVDYLGLPSDEMPFYESGYDNRSSQILSLILKEGNFGYSFNLLDGHPSGFLAGKWFTIKTILHRDFTLYRLYPEMRPVVLGRIMRFLTGGTRRLFEE